MDGCKNNLETASTTRVSDHIPSGFSMSTICYFRSIENKHHIYRDKDCMRKFFRVLKRTRNENN